MISDNSNTGWNYFVYLIENREDPKEALNIIKGMSEAFPNFSEDYFKAKIMKLSEIL